MGVVKDGYNSASRYYLNHLRDASRQAAKDLLLGHRHKPLPDAAADAAGEDTEAEEAESLRLLVQEWQAFFLPEEESLLGAWALLDADAAPTAHSSDLDSIIILTKSATLFSIFGGQKGQS